MKRPRLFGTPTAGLTIWILLLVWAGTAQAQRYLSLEIGGSAGLGSINYEHQIFRESFLHWQLRYGFSLLPIDRNNGTNLIFPVMLHTLLGAKDHKLDLAAGQALSLTTRGQVFLVAPLAAGYRFQPTDRRVFLRLAYTPLLSYLVDLQWQHWAGITIGYRIPSQP